MRIACPSCETAYEVPESVVAAHRMMRCARCQTAFVPDLPPSPVEPEPEPAAPAEPPTLPAPQPVAVPEQAQRMAPMPEAAPPARRPRPAVLAGWALSAGLLVAMVWSAITWQHPIERAWPPSERLYRLLGYK